MKIKLLVLMVFTFLINPLQIAQSAQKSKERHHYKCHLLLRDKSEVVHQFVSLAKTEQVFAKGILGEMVYFADGESGSAIEKVYQCVAAEQRFNSKRARKLEAKTPF